MMSPDPYPCVSLHARDPRPNACPRGTAGRRASHTRSHGRLGVEHRIDPARGETRARAEARRRSRRRRPQGTSYARTRSTHARARPERLEIDLAIDRAIAPESRSRPRHRRRPRAVTMGDRSRVRWSRARFPRRVASRRVRRDRARRRGSVVSFHRDIPRDTGVSTRRVREVSCGGCTMRSTRVRYRDERDERDEMRGTRTMASIDVDRERASRVETVDDTRRSMGRSRAIGVWVLFLTGQDSPCVPVREGKGAGRAAPGGAGRRE